MKKIPSALALLLCFALLAGCGAQAVLHDVAEQLQNANAAEESKPSSAEIYDASDTDAIADDPLSGGHAEGHEEEDDYADASDTDAADITPDITEPAGETALPSGGFVSLALEDCVADAEGTDGQLPRITLDCPGADYINDDIRGAFGYLVDADYCTMYYSASKDGDILSVVIAQLYDGDASYFTPYLLDLSTGEHIGSRELLSRMGLSADEVAAAELDIMGREFEYMYGSMSAGDGADFYNEQYERTVSPDNADTDRLWLDGGALHFVATIYSMAGAEFYEYPMSAGYFYG